MAVVERDQRCVGASIRNFGFVTVTGQPAGDTWRRARTSRDIWARVAPEAGIATATVNQVPGLAPEKDSPAEQLALHLATANSTHAVSYCTEAGLFQQIGIPAVICGPGSIEQAHKPDEYIDTSELRKCEAFMGKLAEQLK